MKWFWAAMDLVAMVIVWGGDLPMWWLKMLATFFFIIVFLEHARAVVSRSAASND